ncbi:MAG: cytoplasmic protein [Deltaproteobacteria bacterium]|nr:cytoplasmic protein [Deltaproteobacteria bacterium]
MAGPDRQHRHDFVETYTGPLAHGLGRDTDLATLQVYLQKLSDDDLMDRLLPRLTAEEVDHFLDLIGRTLSRHLSGEEYHQLFLRVAPKGSR